MVPTMDLVDLRAFLAVAEERHFGRAAERLGISLAQVSQRVRRLEETLKAELLIRTTRSVVVTEAGQQLLSEGRDLVARVTKVESDIRRLGSGRAGILRLGAVGSVSRTLLPRMIKLLERAIPDVKLKITAGMFTPAQEQALLDGAIDLGILRLPLRHASLTYRVVERDPLMLALATNHPLASQDEVRIEDLCREAFVTFPEMSGSIVREAVLTQCARAGFIPKSLVEVSDTGTLLSLVAAGIGVALVPSSAQNLSAQGVRFLDLDSTENIEIALAWQTGTRAVLVHQALSVFDEAGLFIGAERTPEINP